MNSFEVDKHPQYPHGQCISVDRIEYEIGCRGYFRHPRLGRLYGHALSRGSILCLALAWISITLFVYTMGNIRLAKWESLAADQNAYILSLKMQIQNTETNQGALSGCVASMGRIQHALDVIESEAHKIQNADPHNEGMAWMLKITHALKSLL